MYTMEAHHEFISKLIKPQRQLHFNYTLVLELCPLLDVTLSESTRIGLQERSI